MYARTRDRARAFIAPHLLRLTVGHPLSRPFSTRVSDMELPIGYDNFRAVLDNNLDFVDKSLFIKEVLDDRTTQAAVITRPRRFGKTLNLSMLHHFLAAEVQGQPTATLFNRLKIARLGPDYMQHQGRYPVVFMTFKDVRDSKYEAAYYSLKNLAAEVFAEHRYLLESPRLYDEDKEFFQGVLKQKSDETALKNSIKNLTRYLYLHHGVRPWLLIDEYDTPLQSAFTHQYFDPMVEVMRGFLGSVLKTNPYLHRSVITGILRVAKESLFSGVNNLRVYSLLQTRYGEHFGFTEEEVIEILRQSDLAEHLDEVREWYNGYQAGSFVVYNPWSIANYVGNKGRLDAYWVNTSDNQLIKNLLIRSSAEVKDQFEQLLQEQPIEKFIDEHTAFGDLREGEATIWSLLFMSGYLKVKEQHQTEQDLKCKLDIPNYEVRRLYRQIIEQWLSNGHGIDWYQNFLNDLLSGNIEQFKSGLTYIMEQTVSVHDTARDPEAFYHGLMIGLTASLYKNKNYELRSNRESGYGRYDYLIFSKDSKHPTILLEFKKVDSTRLKDPSKAADRLKVEAQDALLQIDQRKYVSEALQRGKDNVLKVGLAFSGKQFDIQYEWLKKPTLKPKL